MYKILICFIILSQIIIILNLKSTCVLTNVNTIITLTVWFIFIYLAYRYKRNILLLGPLLLLALNELLYVNFNIDFFSGQARTQLFYDITTTYFIINGKQNTNLTEGLYLKDINDNSSLMNEAEAKELSLEQVDRNKYNKLFLMLKIQPHEYKDLRILDIGCGNGDFIKYCNSLGIKASGLTISKEQAKSLRDQKLDVYLGSYRDLQPQFIGKYDIVTFWGSLEHITQSYPCSKSGEKKAERQLNRVMGFVKQYYDENSKYKFWFSTTIHMNKNICKGRLDTYLIERAYGGWYFYDEPKQTISDKIESIGFKKIEQDDFTYHYYMASKIDPSHFGIPAYPNIHNLSALLLGPIINPNICAMSLYTLRGEWMWQFDNKTHTFDEPCNSCSFVERSKRPITLLWSVNKLQ